MTILYLEGDACAPKYVKGTLAKAGFDVSAMVAEPVDREPHVDFDLVLLSDYRANDLHESVMRALAEVVHSGDAGLVMVGGWTSLGRGGYANTPIGDALPVELEPGDDRVNRPSGAFIRATRDHAITRDLPWNAPPVVTGYNRVRPRGDADVLVEAVPVESVHAGDAALAEHGDPFVITGRYGEGRVAVVAGDLAPHWSGGWSDWGTPRVDVGKSEEVGGAYLRFVAQLAAWAANMPLPRATVDIAARA